MTGSDTRITLKEVASVATIWLLALFGPLVLADRSARPGWPLIVALAVAYALLAYDAISAWRRGRRLPLLLRVVAPGLLLTLSLAAVHFGLWAAILGRPAGG
jgi:hypothetical protein